ncbi:MAG: polyphosphate kinase 2 family protein [Silvibacterium sp.]|nr:polyphosphate kinase 2 family protein [Silvibacterium sp.]
MASVCDAVIKKARHLAKECRISHGAGFRLKDHDPAETMGFESEDHPLAREALESGVEILSQLQDKLYAQDKWAVLLIFQGMDAAGKDGVVKHVMSGVNPAGCQVYSFKEPSAEDLDHDFLWRCIKCLPNRGHIGIFNRSYYEEVLVVRVHPHLLAAEKVPSSLVTKNIWTERFEDICNMERYLYRNGIVTAKFFLNLSRDEQKRRFLERVDNPDKNWKFSIADVTEREYWDDYHKAFEEMIRNTATRESPWYVIPADNKWFARIVVSAAVIHTLDRLDLSYPKVDKEKFAEIKKARAALLNSR